jgi:hypothetical protein
MPRIAIIRGICIIWRIGRDSNFYSFIALIESFSMVVKLSATILPKFYETFLFRSLSVRKADRERIDIFKNTLNLFVKNFLTITEKLHIYYSTNSKK